MRNVYLVTLFVCVLGVSLLGFRGTKFTAPPIEVFPEWAFPGMKNQPKLRPQSASVFFADGRADRMPPPGVVQRGANDEPLHYDSELSLGKNERGEFIRGFPAAVTVDRAFVEHGRALYTINCVPCHGAVGDGNGITKQYGMGATPSYHDDRLRKMAEGEIFNTITHGKNNMLSYADKLENPKDRWAVISYVRALQRAQTGTQAEALGSNDRNEVAKARKELALP